MRPSPTLWLSLLLLWTACSKEPTLIPAQPAPDPAATGPRLPDEETYEQRFAQSRFFIERDLFLDPWHGDREAEPPPAPRPPPTRFTALGTLLTLDTLERCLEEMAGATRFLTQGERPQSPRFTGAAWWNLAPATGSRDWKTDRLQFATSIEVDYRSLSVKIAAENVSSEGR